MICTPPETVPEIIADLGARGTRAAVVITAGFGGSDGRKDCAAASRCSMPRKPHLLRIIGPNCVGLQIPPLGLNASFAHLLADPGEIAVVTQSGAMATTIIDWAKRHSVGLSYVVSLGDMSDVDFGDVLDYLALSPDTRAILLYIEAVTQAGSSCPRLAPRRGPSLSSRSRPAGRPKAHGRLPPIPARWPAWTRFTTRPSNARASCGSTTSTSSLRRSKPLRGVRSLPGDRLAIVTNGGGIGVLATDALIAEGGRLASLSPETMARLDKVLPTNWSRGEPDRFDRRCGRQAVRRGPTGRQPPTRALTRRWCSIAPWRSRRGSMSHAPWFRSPASADHTFLACWLGGPDLEDVRRLFAAERIPSFDTPRAAISGFLHLIRHRRGQEAILEVPPIARPWSIPPRSRAMRDRGCHRRRAALARRA